MTQDSIAGDWLQWHHHYDTPGSPLAHRLAAVRHQLGLALAQASTDVGVLRLVSVCAGAGRDLLPVLAEQDSSRPVSALLVELNSTLGQEARATATELGLSGVEVRTADAGMADTYLDLPPAHVIMVCGVFGHTDSADSRRLIATLPALLSADGIVIWTRSSGRSGDGPSLGIRSCFVDHGFTEMSFTSTEDGFFRIGTHQLTTKMGDIRPPLPGTRIFTFV